jgi:hypothetical protein
MPLRKIIEEGGVSEEAAQAMHSAFDKVVQTLEPAGHSVQPTAIADYVVRVAVECQYDAQRIVESVMNVIRPK